ncbi:MAG: Activator of Hsp90 ATPase 1 family protein [Xanthobacteraceae bacterium]|nr:Activator of Hsp90 ATPase 1 family protein [Xanthobacteraceae bacterium]
MLMTLDGLSDWTRAKVSDTDVVNQWSLSYEDGPDFVWKVTADDPKLIVWECISGPGDAQGTTAEFALSSPGDSRVLVGFSHSGWPHQEGNFAKCNALWGMLLHHLREVAEGGKPAKSYS